MFYSEFRLFWEVEGGSVAFGGQQLVNWPTPMTNLATWAPY